MQHEDRPIHFAMELLFQPFQIKTPTIQELYYRLSKTSASYTNVDISGQGPPRLFTQRGEKTQSLLLFLPDRLVILEEWVDSPLSSYLSAAINAASQALDVFELDAFTAFTATIRTTFALTYFDHAGAFLIDHVCNQQGWIGEAFGRPIQVGALRFVLPHTDHYKGDLHLTIEPYRHSQRELFVEAKGVFGSDPVRPGELGRINDGFNEVRAFIGDHVYPFLQRYDRIEE